MKKILSIYRFTWLIILVIWVLCLVPFFPETPLDDVPSPQQPRRWTFLWLFILPIIMGGLIEIVQATCTGGHRSGDIMDWAADAVGVVLGQLIGIPLARVASKWNKAR